MNKIKIYKHKKNLKFVICKKCRDEVETYFDIILYGEKEEYIRLCYNCYKLEKFKLFQNYKIVEYYG